MVGFGIPALTPEKGPPGAEKLSGIIGDIIVNGGFPGLSAATEALIAPYRGKPVTAARFYQLAGQIEKLYASERNLLARITIHRSCWSIILLPAYSKSRYFRNRQSDSPGMDHANCALKSTSTA